MAAMRQSARLPLDIDVLFYGDLVGDFDGLVLPRRSAEERCALALSELAPNLEHPVARQLLAISRWRSSRSSGRRHSNGVARLASKRRLRLRLCRPGVRRGAHASAPRPVPRPSPFSTAAFTLTARAACCFYR